MQQGQISPWTVDKLLQIVPLTTAEILVSARAVWELRVPLSPLMPMTNTSSSWRPQCLSTPGAHPFNLCRCRSNIPALPCQLQQSNECYQHGLQGSMASKGTVSDFCEDVVFQYSWITSSVFRKHVDNFVVYTICSQLHLVLSTRPQNQESPCLCFRAVCHLPLSLERPRCTSWNKTGPALAQGQKTLCLTHSFHLDPFMQCTSPHHTTGHRTKLRLLDCAHCIFFLIQNIINRFASVGITAITEGLLTNSYIKFW